MKRKLLKAGKGFERLVRDLEKVMGGGLWDVEAPMLRRDRTTGEQREFDVGIRFRHEHHELVQVFECRDRSRKIDVPAIEAFEAKCRDCNVHRGLIVSARGFYRTAISKAKHLNIGCLTLAEAQTFNWLLARNFGFHHRNLIESGFLLTTGDKEIDDRCENAEAFDAKGAAISVEERNRLVQAVFHQAPIPPNDHEGTARAHIGGCPWFLKDRDGGLHPVTRAILEMRYRATASHLPLELRFYRDEVTGKLLKEVAAARVADANGRELGRMVLSHSVEEGTTMSFIANEGAGPFQMTGVIEYIVPEQPA